MGRALRVRVSALALALAGCAAPPVAPVAPPPVGALEASFSRAVAREQAEPTDVEPYLEAIAQATAHPEDPVALAVTLGALHALAPGLGPRVERAEDPLAFRTREGFQRVAIRLKELWDGLEGARPSTATFQRLLLARALHELALFTGEARGASVWGRRRACASSAAIVGPTDANALLALDEPSAVATTGPMPSSFASSSTFGGPTFERLAADRCKLEPSSANRNAGLRELVVDVDVPSAQRVALVLTTPVAAVVEAGGARVLERRADDGPGATIHFATVEATRGVLRVVVRLADRGDLGAVELAIAGRDGLPLATRAPDAGAIADARASRPTIALLGHAQGERDAALVTDASALIAVGDVREAEHRLEASVLETREGRAPALLLAFVRAMDLAGDMTEAKRQERTAAAIAAARAIAPDAWEVRVVRGELARRRRGAGQGTIEALDALGVPTADASLEELDPMRLAAVVALAQQGGMADVVERAYNALAAKVPGSPMLARVDAEVHPRVGRDRVRALCEGGLSRATERCAVAKSDVGDRRGALAEIARLRELRGAPAAEAELEQRLRVLLGDDAGALAAYRATPPARRSLLGILPVRLRQPDAATALARTREEAIGTNDGPFALARLPALQGRPSADALRFDAEARALVAADKQAPAMPGAATAVLRHVEHYGVDASGLVHALVHDVRRVSGTSDVEAGIFVEQPMIDASGSLELLRQRIHKRDGRVLEPESTPDALQAGTSLSQLEQGDYVEHLYEGWFAPSASGELLLDTADLLPERASVVDAEIAIRWPEGKALSLWSHPLLGEPAREPAGGATVLRWRLRNQAPRRIDTGVPYLERGVRVSLGTTTWAKVGRSVGDNLRGLDDDDPLVRRFAAEIRDGLVKESPGGVFDEATLVGRVVERVGQAVKVSSGGGELSDYAGSSGRTSVRTILEEGVGSRSVVVLRVLRALDIEAEIAVAETEPFATSPLVPPHPGRFRKPLVVAHLEVGDTWIDADVDGPPLPPGRTSPELRGRSAMLGDGQIVAIPEVADAAMDDADLALELDARGDARGTLKLTLRGREAQSLSEALFYLVGDERTQMLRGVVQGWIPWATVDEVSLSSRDGAWEVFLDAKITIAGFGSPESKDGATWALPGFSPAKRSTLRERYAAQAGRKGALTIDRPIQYRVRRSIQLPPGASVARVASPVIVARAGLVARRVAVIKGDRIDESFELTLPTGTVSAADYEAFLAELATVDAGFLAATRVRVKP
jgi:hypothetical protein